MDNGGGGNQNKNKNKNSLWLDENILFIKIDNKESNFRFITRELGFIERTEERKKTERQIWINVHDVIQFF